MSGVFRVNDWLELKLEGSETNIYVNGELFNQCKYLLLEIPIKAIGDYDDIGSIDEAAEWLNDDLEEGSAGYWIKPEEEFWGHCSNLQAWVENNYDTRLLKSNLAFPLLKKLGDYDSKAKFKFSEELIKRLNSGYEPVQEYLLKEYPGYVLNLPSEHIDSVKWSQIKTLDLIGNRLSSLPESIGDLGCLQKLYLSTNRLSSLPESIGNLKDLQVLDLTNNCLSYLPGWISGLTNLQVLDLSSNRLSSLPESIGNLKDLQVLDLTNNCLSSLPDSLRVLEKNGLRVYY
ncbi:hypothetical protein GF352_02085 [archaeon]|nr:hypothetical protein [archaeon]